MPTLLQRLTRIYPEKADGLPLYRKVTIPPGGGTVANKEKVERKTAESRQKGRGRTWRRKIFC